MQDGGVEEIINTFVLRFPGNVGDSTNPETRRIYPAAAEQRECEEKRSFMAGN